MIVQRYKCAEKASGPYTYDHYSISTIVWSKLPFAISQVISNMQGQSWKPDLLNDCMIHLMTEKVIKLDVVI